MPAGGHPTLTVLRSVTEDPCPRRAIDYELDHVVPFPVGSTSEANLAGLCSHDALGVALAAQVLYLAVRFRWTFSAGAVAALAANVTVVAADPEAP